MIKNIHNYIKDVLRNMTQQSKPFNKITIPGDVGNNNNNDNNEQGQYEF